MPRLLGEERLRGPAGPEFRIWKEHLVGEPLTRLTPADLPRVAELLAQFHLRAVVTNDPSRENFLRQSDGRLAFLDFGRAHVHRRHSPWLYADIGKELARLHRTAIGNDAAHWSRFLAAYEGLQETRAFPLVWIRRCHDFWVHR